MNEELKNILNKAFSEVEDKANLQNHITEYIYKNLTEVQQPISNIKWIPVSQIQPNDYNPNAVASQEMKLLYTSIKHDGYTQPIVTIFDEEKQKYIIVDGFHRYFTCKNNKDIYERNKGLLPIVVIEKSINERMAATVRHNRARGEHSITGMSSMVFNLLKNGWTEAEVCNYLGMEPEEVLKLKHITGFSKLFEDHEFNKAWRTKRMIKIEKEEQEKHDNNEKREEVK